MHSILQTTSPTHTKAIGTYSFSQVTDNVSVSYCTFTIGTMARHLATVIVSMDMYGLVASTFLGGGWGRQLRIKWLHLLNHAVCLRWASCCTICGYSCCLHRRVWIRVLGVTGRGVGEEVSVYIYSIILGKCNLFTLGCCSICGSGMLQCYIQGFMHGKLQCTG